MAAKITYTAEIRNDSIMIYVQRYAGICGPGATGERPATMAEANVWVDRQGFARVTDWEITDTYEGMMLKAELRKL
jgi:hypothetical protein